MSEDLLVKLYEAIDTRRWDVFPEIFTADVIYERPGTREITGLGELTRFYRDLRPIAQSQHQLTQVVSDGKVGACAGRLLARDLEGNPVDQRFADIFEFQGEKVRRRITYFFR